MRSDETVVRELRFLGGSKRDVNERGPLIATYCMLSRSAEEREKVPDVGSSSVVSNSAAITLDARVKVAGT